MRLPLKPYNSLLNLCIFRPPTTTLATHNNNNYKNKRRNNNKYRPNQQHHHPLSKSIGPARCQIVDSSHCESWSSCVVIAPVSTAPGARQSACLRTKTRALLVNRSACGKSGRTICGRQRSAPKASNERLDSVDDAL